MRHPRRIKGRKLRTSQQKIAKVDGNAFTPPQFTGRVRGSISDADALDWAHVHQVPGVKVLVGRRIKDACKSLRETLTSSADGDRIEMLKRTLRSVLIEKRVTVVRRLSKDLEGLAHQLFYTVDER